MVTFSRRKLQFTPVVTIAAILILIAFFILVRMPEIILKGRFWAEEGHNFFHYVWLQPPLKFLLNNYGGYWNLAEILSIFSAFYLVPLQYAPYVTITLGLIFQLLPFYLILTAKNWLSNWYIRILAVLMILFAPATEEMWLQSLHIAVQLLLCCGIILISPCRSGKEEVFQRFIIVFASLSNAGCIAFFPLFCLRAWIDKDRKRAQQALWMGFGIIIQFIFFFDFFVRIYQNIMRGEYIASTIILKNFLLPVIGVDLYNDHIKKLFEICNDNGHLWLSYIFLIICGGIVFGLSLIKKICWPAIWSFLAFFSLAPIAYRGQLYGMPFIYTTGGGHYTFVPQALLYLGMLVLLQHFSQNFKNKFYYIGYVFCLWIVFIGVKDYFNPPSYAAHGPSWAKEVKKWRKNPSYHLHSWPAMGLYDVVPYVESDEFYPDGRLKNPK